MLNKLIITLVATISFANPTFALESLPITIGAAGPTDHAPIFAGVERGIFAKHGLDAKVEMYQSGVDMVNGLSNGPQQVNVMGSVPLLLGLSKGLPLVLIGHLHGDPNRDAYSDNQSIVSSASSNVAAGDVSSLKGKRIGVPRGTGAEGYLLGVLGEAGLGEGDIELINVGPSELVTALNQNDVDAIAIWVPWGSTALTKVAGAVRVQQGGCPSCYDPGALLTTQKIIDSDHEVLNRFMAAFAESQQWVRPNQNEAANINMRWIQGVDLDTMKLAIATAALDPRISKLTAEIYQAKSMPFLKGLGRIDKVFDPSYAINTSFLDYALKNNPSAFSDLDVIPENLQMK